MVLVAGDQQESMLVAIRQHSIAINLSVIVNGERNCQIQLRAWGDESVQIDSDAALPQDCPVVRKCEAALDVTQFPYGGQLSTEGAPGLPNRLKSAAVRRRLIIFSIGICCHKVAWITSG
jgi:hypothetical protein